MRYSCTALVLATALVSRVAAGPVHHAHQHVHEKKEAALKVEEVEADLEKKDLPADYWQTASILYTNDWTTLSIWKTVDYTYSEGQTWGDPTPVANNEVPASTTAPAVVATTTPAAQPVSTPSSTPAPSPAPSPAASPVSGVLASGDSSKILAMGFSAAGLNSQDSSAGVWLGNDGPYTNEFINSSGEDIVLVIWGADGSWVNAKAPLITVSMPPGGTITVSFASGQSGAWAGLYGDTTLVNGQVCNTWGEYTFSPPGVVDVSKEVNMNGHGMSIVGPQCTTDMNTCVFECSDPGVTSCEFDYELLNCSAGSQPGAQYGTYGGAASGGCGWLGANSAKLTTTFT